MRVCPKITSICTFKKPNHVFNANVITLMQFTVFKVHIVGNNERLCKQNHWEILDVALLKLVIYWKM